MKLKLKLFDFFIILIFMAAIAVSATKIFSDKSKAKILMIQTHDEKFAYSMEKDTTLEIPGLIGRSRIIIKDGEAWFEDSPCDNKICIEAGKINRQNQWAACLPNGIIIFIEGKAGNDSFDAVSN